MPFSPSVPLLIAALTGMVVWSLRRTLDQVPDGPIKLRRMYGLFGFLAVWCFVTTTLAATGFYIGQARGGNVPFLFFPLVPSVVVVAWIIISHSLRNAVWEVVERTPIHIFVYVHALRIAAVGTVAKYLSGELPAHFILPVGVPDLVFGVTAIVIGRLASKGTHIPPRVLMGWNFLGVGVFLLAIPLMHLSMPGPLRTYFTGPTTEEVFSFPMALVPTFMAPMLILLHAATIWKLVGESRSPAHVVPDAIL